MGFAPLGLFGSLPSVKKKRLPRSAEDPYIDPSVTSPRPCWIVASWLCETPDWKQTQPDSLFDISCSISASCNDTLYSGYSSCIPDFTSICEACSRALSLSYTSLAHPGDSSFSSFSSDKTQINLLFKKELRSSHLIPTARHEGKKQKQKKKRIQEPPQPNRHKPSPSTWLGAVRLPSQGFTFQGIPTNDSPLTNTPHHPGLVSSSIFLSSICPTHRSWRLPSQLPMSSLAMVWAHSPIVAPWTRIYTLTIPTQRRPRTRCLTNQLPRRLRIALALPL